MSDPVLVAISAMGGILASSIFVAVKFYILPRFIKPRHSVQVITGKMTRYDGNDVKKGKGIRERWRAMGEDAHLITDGRDRF